MKVFQTCQTSRTGLTLGTLVVECHDHKINRAKPDVIHYVDTPEVYEEEKARHLEGTLSPFHYTISVAEIVHLTSSNNPLRGPVPLLAPGRLGQVRGEAGAGPLPRARPRPRPRPAPGEGGEV